MKKIIGVLGVAIIVMTLFLNVNQSKNGDLTLDNITALNQAQASESDMTIYCTVHMAPVCFYYNGVAKPGYLVGIEL